MLIMRWMEIVLVTVGRCTSPGSARRWSDLASLGPSVGFDAVATNFERCNCPTVKANCASACNMRWGLLAKKILTFTLIDVVDPFFEYPERLLPKRYFALDLVYFGALYR